MASALKRPKPFSGEVVRLYEEDQNRPGKEARRALALALGVEESYIEFGTGQTHKAEQRAASYAIAPQSAAEEMILELFRGLTREQQRELVIETKATVDANREIQSRFIGRPIRTVSNEDVAAAFGPLPAPAKPATKRRRGAAPAEEDPE